MIRVLFALIVSVLCCNPGKAADEENQLDASPALFSVMAAINAAGYDADLQSPANHPFREALRKELASRNIPCLEELKQFFADHRQQGWTAELSQYISFALVVDGPPAFKYRLRQNELPPDVVQLEGFAPLMERFHREAGVDALWQQAQPAFEEMIARYHGPVVRAVTEVNAYLRNPMSGFRGRRFQIYVDILAAPNQIQTRSYGNEYFVVVTPSPEPQADDVRHAYLHYLLDPLATRYAEELDAKKALGDYVQAAPLEDYYKSDFLLLATESLIKAVESRLLHGSVQKKQELVEEAQREGFILTPHFAEQLPHYEAQEQAMRFYFPEMVKAIDLKREDQRLKQVEFLSQRPVRKAKEVPAARKVEPTGVDRTLQEAEQAYTSRDLEKAKQGYLQVLQETEEKPLHAKAYYGLARVAALQNDPDTSEKLFLKVLDSSPEPQVKAWALVYLGRLADLAGQRETAGQHYQAALKVQGASPGALKAAQQGLQESFKKSKE